MADFLANRSAQTRLALADFPRSNKYGKRQGNLVCKKAEDYVYRLLLREPRLNLALELSPFGRA